MKIEVAPPWWHSCQAGEKRLLEDRVLSVVVAVLADHGLRAEIAEFGLECPHPWSLEFSLGVSMQPVCYERIYITATFVFRELTRLRATTRSNYPGSDGWRAGQAVLAALQPIIDDLKNPPPPPPEEDDVECEEEAPTPAPVHLPKPSANTPSVRADLLSAMKSLGFPKPEAALRADRAFAKAPAGATLHDLITLALKKETPPC